MSFDDEDDVRPRGLHDECAIEIHRPGSVIARLARRLTDICDDDWRAADGSDDWIVAAPPADDSVEG